MRKALIVLLVLVMLGSVMAPTTAVNKRASEKLKLPEELTKEELLQLYRKYNITENDIRFAKGELPHPMDGTILDGSRKVLITEDGRIPQHLREKLQRNNISFDLVLSKKEMLSVIIEAEKKYRDMYGVDPANPKVVIVNGVPIPKEYAQELVRKGKIKPGPDRVLKPAFTTSTQTSGPHQVNGVLYAYFIIALNDDYGHAPDSFSRIAQGTTDALQRFETEFGVDIVDLWITGWDLSDVCNNASEALDDLREDWGWLADNVNDVVFGWADNLDRNGIAYPDGTWYHSDGTWGAFAPFAIASENIPAEWDWPEDSVVQHEMSHLFDAPDRGTWWWEHPECIMNYWYAYWGTDIWGSEDWTRVYHNIWGYW